jgi:AmmeMemoRadiSam system protein B
MPVVSDTRPSPIAGMWYEGDPSRLTLQIEDYLATAQPPAIEGEVIGLVAPHAGHIYSGATAAYAYKTVMCNSYDVVAVVSPLHKYHPAPLLTSAHQSYQTPLGKIQVDHESVEKINAFLGERGPLQVTPMANDDEHSIEIQLPFLQRALEGSFDLLPIMARRRDAKMAYELGLALARVLTGRKALLVASTDLSHFYPLQVANLLDDEMLRQFEAFSPEGVLKADDEGTGFACGAGAVAVVFNAARELGATDVKILQHTTSAEQTGDTRSVVGYGAAAIYKRN